MRQSVSPFLNLAAAIVRAGERRAATLAAGGALDLADAVFTIDCLAAHVETNEAMLRATEGDFTTLSEDDGEP